MPQSLRRGADLNGFRLTSVGDGVNPTDAVTLQQAENIARGVSDLKDPVRLATTTSITLSGLQSIDGVTPVAGDRILVKNQTDNTTNRIYVAASGAWTVATDNDSNSEVTRGLSTTVLDGVTKGTGTATTNPVTWIADVQGAITLGTTPLPFRPIGGGAIVYTGGAGLVLSGTDFAIGQGNGILVDADQIRVDPSIVSRKYAADCVATTNPQSFVHGLGAEVLAEVWQNMGGGVYEKVGADITRTTANGGTVTIDWGSAPTAGVYRVNVQG